MSAINLKEYLLANTLQDDSLDDKGNIFFIIGVSKDQIATRFQGREHVTIKELREAFPDADIEEVETE